MTPLNEIHAEGLDGGRLAHPRHTRDADVHRRTGARHQLHEQTLRPLAMVRAGRLDEGDRAGQGGPVTPAQRLCHGADVAVCHQRKS